MRGVGQHLIGTLLLAGALHTALAGADVVTNQGQSNPAADAAFVRAIYADWYLPRSADFASKAQDLTHSMQALCSAGESAVPAARAQWLRTVSSWEVLAAVRGGALLARRSPREIDFMPVRPDAIRRAVASAPRDAIALDSIGSPAKGLPALEWLLWERPLASDPAACAYANLVAAAVAAEAEALQQAYRRTLSQGWDGKESEYAMYEFLNLWDAGLQKLWWEEIDRPLQKSQDTRAPQWSRATSGHTVAGWRLQWQALRALALGDPFGVQGPCLRQRLLADGHAAEAEHLATQAAAVDAAFAALPAASGTSPSSAGVAALVAALKDLQQFAESDMAAALGFIISFFDEDGD